MLSNRNFRRSMYDSVPKYYYDIREAGGVIGAESEEIERLNVAISDVLDQFYVNVATWGLADWEDFLGLPTDESRSLSGRRSSIKSRMRGAGTTTAEMIQNVAESYVYGGVEVDNDSANYSVTIRFIDTRGVPDSLDDIKQSLIEIVPAHLAVDFNFTYLTYDEIINEGVTYGDVKSLGLTYSEFKVHKYS